MKFRAHKVMWVYASGKRVADFLLRLKNARGRPRPPALNERSTRPFASSEFKCFSVAILEIRSSADMSVSETVPRRLSVTRICFLADEKPESRPPESTSFTFMLPQAKAFRYHIPNRLQSRESERHRSDSPPEEGKEERGGGQPPICHSAARRRRRRRLSLATPHDDDRDDQGDRNHGGGDGRHDKQGAARTRRRWELEVRLDVCRDGRVVDDRRATAEAQPREEDESDERVAPLADRRETEAANDFPEDGLRDSVDGAGADPHQVGDPSRVAHA